MTAFSLSIKCDMKASEIALNQDNTVCELTVESKLLQVGRYINELAGREQRDHKRTAGYGTAPPGDILTPTIWFLPCWGCERGSFVHVSLRVQLLGFSGTTNQFTGFFCFCWANTASNNN